MPVFNHDYLYRVAFEIYRSEGVPQEEARIVATHQLKANLAGHDSHGILHIPEYVEQIHRGHIVPGAPFEVVNESPTTARINGHWGFGFVVMERVMRMAIEKASTNNVASMTVFYQSQIGRLRDYAAMAVEEGMIGLITADSGAGPKAVAPFGGRERRLGTNPICIGVPSDLDGPLILDMATSAVAAGKVVLARNRREQIPDGWVIDKHGRPTTDPNDFYDGGAILPLGADQGHKGYGLSFMVETFSGILAGLGSGIDPLARHNAGCFIAVFNVEAFRPLAEFKKEVTEFARFVKDTPPAQGFSEVFYPGEIGWRTEQQRRREGVYIEEETWEQIWALAKAHNLDDIIGRA